MDAIQTLLNNSEVKPKPASGVVTLKLPACRGFAANDPRVHQGCSGSHSTTASVELFPGQYFDEETQLHYNHFRYYDPQTGRYIQSDRIGLGDGTNTYGYVHQNPLTGYDPTGEFTTGCVGVGCWLSGFGKKRNSGSSSDDCENCEWPVTINWTTGGAVKIQPDVRKTYSGKCLLTLGIGIKATTTVAGSVIVGKSPGFFSSRGMARAASVAAKGAAVFNSPPSIVLGATTGAAGVLESCECDVDGK